MEVVAGIDAGVQLGEVVGVAGGGVKVEHRVERAARADPAVHRETACLAVPAVVVRVVRAEGRDRRAEHGDALRVHARDDLLERGDEVAHYLRLRGGVRGRGADVVHALEDDGARDTRLREHVAVDAAKCVGAEAVGEYAVAARGLVEVGDGVVGTSPEAIVELIGPAIMK